MTMRRVKGCRCYARCQRIPAGPPRPTPAACGSADTLADSLRAGRRGSHRTGRSSSTGRPGWIAGTLHERAVALAAAMLARFPVGSVVSFMLPNWHEAAVDLPRGDAGRHGGQPDPAVAARPRVELHPGRRRQRMSSCPPTFGGHDYAAMLARVTAEHGVAAGGRGGARCGAGRADRLRRRCTRPNRPVDWPVLDADAVRMILYTSGTTGRPKGVLHSHNSIHALIRQIGRHWRVEPGDRFLVPSPIAHIGGSIYAFECPILLGTTAVLMDRWNAERAVDLLIAERCTHMAGATPFLEQILAAARHAGTRLPDLKVFICGGASVPPSLIRSAADYFERAIVTRVYGSTEVPVTTVGSPDDPATGPPTPTAVPASRPSAWPPSRSARRRRRDPRPRPADARSATCIPRTTPTPSTTTATSAPAIWADWSTTATSSSPGGPRTSSSATARTSRPRRSRTC